MWQLPFWYSAFRISSELTSVVYQCHPVTADLLLPTFSLYEAAEVGFQQTRGIDVLRFHQNTFLNQSLMSGFRTETAQSHVPCESGMFSGQFVTRHSGNDLPALQELISTGKVKKSHLHPGITQQLPPGPPFADSRSDSRKRNQGKKLAPIQIYLQNNNNKIPWTMTHKSPDFTARLDSSF